MSVYGSVSEKDRPQMIDYILRRVESGGTRTYYKRRTMYSRLLPEWSVSYR